MMIYDDTTTNANPLTNNAYHPAATVSATIIVTPRLYPATHLKSGYPYEYSNDLLWFDEDDRVPDQ